MNQKLTFTAFLQDEYSKKFDKLAERTDADIKQIEKDMQKLSRTGKQAAMSINDLNKRIEVLTRVKKMTIDTKAIKFASKEIEALQKQKEKLEGNSRGGGFMGSGIGNGFAMAGGAAAIIYATGRGIKNAVEANMEREQQRISMGVLLGNQDKGDTMLNDIVKMAARTPMTTSDLLKSNQTMLGFGVDPSQTLKYMQQLGDITGGNAERFQSMTLAFSQMFSTGRLMGQDLLQMVNAGFNPLKVISEQTGKSMKQLKKDMEDGNISVEMVTNAMQKATGAGGLFHGMMDKQSQTTSGRLSTMKDNVNEMSVAIGERFTPAVNGSIDMLSGLSTTIKKWLEIPASRKIEDQANSLRVLKAQLNDTNIAEERRKEILNEINNKYGNYLTNINLEKSSYEELNNALTNTITLLDKKSKKARLDEVLKDSEDDLNNAYRVRTSAINSIYSTYRKDFPGIIEKEGLTSDEKIKLLKAELSKKDNASGISRLGIGDAKVVFNSFEESAKMIAEGQKKLKETSADVQRQMKDEGLYGLETPADNPPPKPTKPDDEKGKIKSKKSGSGTSVPSISGSSKITHLTINIDSLIKGGVNIHRATVQDGAAEMKNLVSAELLTAVNDANLAVGNN